MNRYRLAGVLWAVTLLTVGCITENNEIPQGPPREIRIVNNVEVSDDDLSLTVRYWGTQCEEFSESELSYGITQVEITVYALVTTEQCERSGNQQTTVISLAEPLNNRIVIDANTNTVVWEP
ncbi:MAG: hypothetical protein OXE04_06485 [bacterium]|nr:hypothetical protein [bacterium]MCY4257923.1 hypothetical protein [bacterium]